MPKTPVPFQPQDPSTSPEVVSPAAVVAPATPAAPEPVDYDAAWNALEEPVRLGIAERFGQTFNQQIEEQYGDILPLVREANANPKLRDALKAFASDAELREYIADGGTLEQIRGLQKDPAYREFLFKDATEAYRKYPQQQQQAADPMEPVLSRINSLESQLTERDQAEAFRGYVSSRQTEMQALQNAAPALKENLDLLEHIVTQAENNYKLAAANSGINTAQPDNVWAAQAVRAGIRPPQYIDVYRQYERLTGKTPPPSAAGTPSSSSPARAGRGVQAPRTKVEGAKLSQQERREQTIAQMKKRTLTAVKG